MSTRKLVLNWVFGPVEHTLLQVPRALVASSLAAAVDLGLLVLLVQGFGSPLLPAATLAYLLAGVLQYYLCAVWVFPAAPERAVTGFFTFTVLSLGGLVITWVTLAALSDWLGVNYALAKMAALVFAFAWNFLSRKYLLFR